MHVPGASETCVLGAGLRGGRAQPLLPGSGKDQYSCRSQMKQPPRAVCARRLDPNVAGYVKEVVVAWIRFANVCALRFEGYFLD